MFQRLCVIHALLHKDLNDLVRVVNSAQTTSERASNSDDCVIESIREQHCFSRFAKMINNLFSYAHMLCIW